MMIYLVLAEDVEILDILLTVLRLAPLDPLHDRLVLVQHQTIRRLPAALYKFAMRIAQLAQSTLMRLNVIHVRKQTQSSTEQILLTENEISNAVDIDGSAVLDCRLCHVDCATCSVHSDRTKCLTCMNDPSKASLVSSPGSCE
jgi:hypothetical protein